MADKKTTGVPKRSQGLHHARCLREHNEAELIFARAWHRLQDQTAALNYMLNPEGPGPNPAYVDDRDRFVAATVIQWLGSPIGMDWLTRTLSRARQAELRQLSRSMEGGE